MGERKHVNDAQELLEKLEELPPVPAVAAQVMAMVADDHSSAADLSEVISTDHALTAKLLRMSNSAYYSFARPVENVRDAVTLLGVRQVREVAVTMSLMDAFEPTEEDSDFDLELFWAHSVAVAVIAEAVAIATRAAKPADAFTAGVVHDIGRLVLHQARAEQFIEAVVEASESGRPLAEAEAERTGFSHAELGRALGERWNFPAALVEAVGSHHDEGLSREEDGLSWVLMQANRLALHYGLFCGYESAEDFEADPLPDDLAEIEQFAGGIDSVLDRAVGFVNAATGQPLEEDEEAA